MTDLDILKTYPAIEWRKPIRLVLNKESGWACRMCIAQIGIKGTDAHRLLKNYGKFFVHLREEHPLL